LLVAVLERGVIVLVNSWAEIITRLGIEEFVAG